MPSSMPATRFPSPPPCRRRMPERSSPARVFPPSRSATVKSPGSTSCTRTTSAAVAILQTQATQSRRRREAAASAKRWSDTRWKQRGNSASGFSSSTPWSARIRRQSSSTENSASSNSERSRGIPAGQRQLGRHHAVLPSPAGTAGAITGRATAPSRCIPT